MLNNCFVCIRIKSITLIPYVVIPITYLLVIVVPYTWVLTCISFSYMLFKFVHPMSHYCMNMKWYNTKKLKGEIRED